MYFVKDYDNVYHYAGIFNKLGEYKSSSQLLFSNNIFAHFSLQNAYERNPYLYPYYVGFTFYIVEQTNANDLETGDFIYIDEIDRQPPRQALYRIIENDKKDKYVTVSSANKVKNKNAKIYQISTITWKKFRIVTDNYKYYVNKVKAGRIPNRQRKTRRVNNKKRKTLQKNNIKRKRSNPTRKY